MRPRPSGETARNHGRNPQDLSRTVVECPGPRQRVPQSEASRSAFLLPAPPSSPGARVMLRTVDPLPGSSESQAASLRAGGGALGYHPTKGSCGSFDCLSGRSRPLASSPHWGACWFESSLWTSVTRGCYPSSEIGVSCGLWGGGRGRLLALPVIRRGLLIQRDHRCTFLKRYVF